MNRAVFVVGLRLRLPIACLTAVSMAVVIIMVGALFPSVGGTIGKLNVPKGVANLLGGADYGTLRGWMRSEIGAVYGPLVVAATAIASSVSLTASEEDAGILGLVLAQPVERGRMMLAKAVAVAVTVVIVATGTFLGLVIGVEIGGGGIDTADQGALALHLACFGFAIGAVALALAGATGRRSFAIAGASAVGVIGFLINGFAPLLHAIAWLKYVSPFYYYSGHDPIANGIDSAGISVLVAATLILTAIAVIGFRRRDLRA